MMVLLWVACQGGDLVGSHGVSISFCIRVYCCIVELVIYIFRVGFAYVMSITGLHRILGFYVLW